ncbi:MAG: hypothetical protein IT436_07760 [Phycisphaerales bacterium]|nr:hypothetical protein [Phycisphaerales bacterium]
MSAPHGHYTTPIADHVDNWHHHSVALEGAPQAEHAGTVNPFILGQWFVLIVLSVVGTCVVLFFYFEHYATQFKAQQAETVSWSAEYVTYKATTDGQLNGKPEWLDHDRLRLPIGDAMAKVVKQYQAMEKPAK